MTGRNLAGRQDHATRGGQEYHNTDGVGQCRSICFKQASCLKGQTEGRIDKVICGGRLAHNLCMVCIRWNDYNFVNSIRGQQHKHQSLRIGRLAPPNFGQLFLFFGHGNFGHPVKRLGEQDFLKKSEDDNAGQTDVKPNETIY